MKLNAIMASRILIAAIVVLIGSAGAVFYYAGQFLSQVVTETNHAEIDADISSQNVLKLKQLENELDEKADIVKRTEQIIAESSQYQYQDQIVNDINAYAARTGVVVTGYSFQSADEQKKKPAVRIPGVTTLTATVSLQAPVPYDNFLRFLKAIEQNLTKMQVTGVSVSPDQEDLNAISNPSVGLLIYVKDKS